MTRPFALATTLSLSLAACVAGTAYDRAAGDRDEGDAPATQGDTPQAGDTDAPPGDGVQHGGDWQTSAPFDPVLIAAGGYHTCVLHRGGSVSCWGRRLLSGSDFGDRTRPLSVPGLSGITQIAMGYEFGCALDDVGRVHCWGSNGGGQLGDGTASGGPAPRATQYTGVKSLPYLTMGHYHSAVIYDDGTLGAAGYNNGPTEENNSDGQLGIGSTDTTPVAHENPTPVLNITGATQASLGHFHNCVLAGTTVWCWGYNGWGELGTGDIEHADAPVTISLSNVSQLALGHQHSCALMQDRTVSCWGKNSDGSLGTGLPDGASTPTPVPGLTDIVQIAANYRHVCAVDAAGELYCWGDNTYGQLGAVAGDQRSPVHLTMVSDVRQVAVGLGHTCVLLGDGGAKCWGYNVNGQLGNGLVEDSNTPVGAQLLTACGDTACNATEGELCGNCPDDCSTRDVVCGNGECQGTETEATCPSDCAPTVWPAAWSDFEDQVFALVNERRAAGGSCPTSGAKPAVGALTEAALLRNAARRHAWDMSYANYSSHDSCNGRSPAERAAALAAPYRSENLASWIEAPEAVVTAWMASEGHCTNIMDPVATRLGVGYARYATVRWVLMFE